MNLIIASKYMIQKLTKLVGERDKCTIPLSIIARTIRKSVKTENI